MPFPLVTPEREGGVGWGGGLQAGSWAPAILIVGDPDAPKGVGAPLPPIEKMNTADPSAPRAPW